MLVTSANGFGLCAQDRMLVTSANGFDLYAQVEICNVSKWRLRHPLLTAAANERLLACAFRLC